MEKSTKNSIILVFIIVSLVFFVWQGAKFFYLFFGSPQEIETPNILQKDVKQAENILKKYRLKLVVIDSRFDENVPENTVLSQNPSPGRKVRAGREVSAVICSGPDLREVPNLFGLTAREGEIMLSNYKLRVGKIIKQADSKTEPERIFKQEPPPGTMIKTGSGVDLYINTGGAPSIKVPSWKDKDIQQVKDDLNKLGLRTGQIIWTLKEETPFGQVISQGVKEGEMVYPDSLISFEVSLGASYEIGQIKQTLVDFTLYPGPRREVEVYLTDKTGRSQIYKGFITGGQNIKLFVSSFGAGEVIIYVDKNIEKRIQI